MKQSILSLLLMSIAFSSLVPSSAIAMTARAQQVIANEVEKAQKTLTVMQNNLNEFGKCVLQGNCSSDKQKNLSTVLKGSAAALGALILALVAAAVVSGQPKDGSTSTTPINKNPTDTDRTKFLHAIQTGNRDLAEQMIKAGVNPNTEFEYIGGLNALSLAAQDGDSQMVVFLLSHGAIPQLNEKVEATVSPEIKKIIATYRSTGGRKFYIAPKSAPSSQ